MDAQTAVVAQVPYWVAVLTPEERTFGSRRTDPRIDAIDNSVVTETSTQWVGAEHPSNCTLLAVLAATVGSWQSDRCRSNASGVLIDIENSHGDLYPVRLPSTGNIAALTEEVGRRIAATPNAGGDYAVAKHTMNVPALSRKPGAQIAFQHRSKLDDSKLDDSGLDDSEPLRHNLTVSCEVTDVDGVTMLDARFRWNCRAFTRADVDDFERFWEKTVTLFV